jgi:carbamoylphosphate synthase small subunit
VGKIPKGFKEWFYNANDNTNEGIIHKSLPFMSVQFHPEASPGPLDADWIFDEFIKKI